MSHLVPLQSFIEVIRDGDEHGWLTESIWLWQNQSDRMWHLSESIRRAGIQEPILVGNDGRVWDGHHRVCVAMYLKLTHIPVVFSGEED